MKMSDLQGLRLAYLVAWLAPVCVVVLVVSRILFPQLYFGWLTAREASFAEGLAPLAGLLAAPVGLLAFIEARKKGLTWPWCIGLLVLALGGLYAAGEELSWGQHLIAFETPDWWEPYNFQGETNLHNTRGWMEGIFLTLPHNTMIAFTLAIGIVLPVGMRILGNRMASGPGWLERLQAKPTIYVPAAVTALLVYYLRKTLRAFGVHYEYPDYGAITEVSESLFLLFLLAYLTSVLVYLKSMPRLPVETTARD
jgi:hypothetical protein